MNQWTALVILWMYVTPGPNGWCLEGDRAMPPAVTTSTWLSYTLCYTYPSSSTWKSSYLRPPCATGLTCAPVLNGSGHLCWPESSNIGVSWDGRFRYTFQSPAGGLLNSKFGFQLLSTIGLTSRVLPRLFQLIHPTYPPPPSFTQITLPAFNY
jgi:hypothetical protein